MTAQTYGVKTTLVRLSFKMLSYRELKAKFGTKNMRRNGAWVVCTTEQDNWLRMMKEHLKERNW